MLFRSWLTSESGPGQDAVTSVQLLVRTGLLLQLTRSTRVTVGLAGVAAYELADRSVGGRIEHSELHFTLEHRLRLPKRLLPDL